MSRVNHLETSATPFGASVRRWRRMRGTSQLELAHRAGTTSRHLSFLETGRSRPSRDMVARLAEALQLQLREANDLFRSAGLASAYPESAFSESDLAPFTAVVEQMLHAHNPFPAYAIDRRWNIVQANSAAQRFLPDSPERNVVRLTYAGAWRNLIANWDDIAWPGALRLQRESAQHPDDEELADLATLAVEACAGLAAQDVMPAGRVLCPAFRFGDDLIRTISVVAQFGGARDVTLEELRIELFFPADEQSAQHFMRLSNVDG